MRLAWFSPWPPDPSGIAGRSAEIVPLLASRGHAIDVFVDERRVRVAHRAADAAPAPGAVRVQSAHDFPWRAARGQYDLPVYQAGNSRLHEFLWPYLFRYPGLVILHDARLHHARGRALLSRRAYDAYRAEFHWDMPDVSPDAAELAIAGFGGRYYYQWPMTRAVLERARLVAAHSAGAAAELAAAFPGRPAVHVALGEGRRARVAEPDRVRFRRNAGMPDDACVFGVFGGLTIEKRIEPILRAFAVLASRDHRARLLLAGEADPALDLDRQIAAAGVAPRVVRLGHLDADAFDVAIAAADVSLNLRWPTSLEMSGPWLRALAASRPTVLVDLSHLAHVPTLDSRTWALHQPATTGATPRDAVAIAIDILDEDHSLRLAMRRLASDPALRASLGAAGRAYWDREHTVERMADDYERAFAVALAQPVPDAPVPSHLRPDPLAHAGDVVRAFNLPSPLC